MTGTDPTTLAQIAAARDALDHAERHLRALALAAVAGGESTARVAYAALVSRQTVYNWQQTAARTPDQETP